MKELYLRECRNTYYKLDKKRKYTVYHDPKNNNLIVFSPFDDCTVDSVCGAIREDAYLYLINELNTKHNLVVSWSEVSGTTSDYRIYYDMDVNMLKEKLHDEILKIISDTVVTCSGNCKGYKYTKVRNGNITEITPQMMSRNNIVYVFDYINSEYLN